MANNMKKDFQKVVKMFRESLPDYMGLCYNFETHEWEKKPCRPEYPKAMMTEQQIRKGTATINCGHEETAIGMMDYEPFKIWCESYGIKSVKHEMNSDKRYQVRVTF